MSAHPMALIHGSNLKDHEKTSIRQWAETILGKTGSEERTALRNRATNHIVEAGAVIRSVGTGGITGGVLGAVEGHMGIDLKGFPIDGISAGLFGLGAIAAAHDLPEVAKTSRDMAAGASGYFFGRKTREFFSEKKGGSSAKSPSAKAHGDPHGDLIDFAKGMQR